MLNLIIFGPPGSGKGTNADKLLATYGGVIIRTGDIFRKMDSAPEYNAWEPYPNGHYLFPLQSEFNQKFPGFLTAGTFIPDEFTLAVVSLILEKEKGNRIFDGFPRNKKQAISLKELILQKKQRINGFIELRVEIPELVRRLNIRGRGDDAEQTVLERIQKYNQDTRPILDWADGAEIPYLWTTAKTIDKSLSNDEQLKLGKESIAKVAETIDMFYRALLNASRR